MKTDIIVDLQLGSSGKGKFAQYLTKKNNYNLCIKGGGSNAGHTIYLNSVKVKLRHLPVGTFSDKNVALLLDASSVIDLDILKEECLLAEKLGYSVRNRLFIDVNAGLITEAQKNSEKQLIDKIGSVGTGTGFARISRLKRDDSFFKFKDAGYLYEKKFTDFIQEYKITFIKSFQFVNSFSHNLIEGYQATHLDVLHSEFYPYCTSWGCTATALAWNAGIAPSNIGDVYGVFCPIMTRPGINTGGTFPDSKEISWEELRKKCGSTESLVERAATSGRIRRAFTFSSIMFTESQLLNKPNYYALIRADYIDWSLRFGQLTDKVENWIFNNLSPLGVDHILKNLNYISYGPHEEEYLIP